MATVTLKKQLYAKLESVDSKGYAHFVVLPIGEYVQSNNVNKILPTDTMAAADTTINSFLKAGLSTPSNPIMNNVAGISWKMDNTDGTRAIKLDRSKDSIRELTPGNFYSIEIITAPNSKSSSLSSYLQEGPRVKILPIEKAITSNSSVNDFIKLNAAEKLAIQKLKNFSIPPRQTTTSINRENKSFIDGSPTVKTSSTVNLDPYVPRYQDSVKAVKSSLIKSGVNFSVPTPLDAEPTLESLDTSFDPALESRMPTIVPIALKFEEEEFTKAETYMRIGYTKLLVPPQAINIRSDSGLQNVEVLRNQGTLKSGDYNTMIS